MEKALRASERSYRNLFENAHDAILIVDPRRKVVLEANRRALALYGFTRREFIGLSLTRISRCPKAWDGSFGRLLARGRMPGFESVHVRRTGAAMTVSVHTSLIDFGGKTSGLMMVRDVTAQRDAERSLRESEQRLRAAMNASLDATYLLSAVRNAAGRIVDFRFIEANPRGLALLSATRATLIGGLLCELLPINRTAGFFDRYARVAETGQPLEETFPMTAPWRRSKWRGLKWLRQQVVRLGDGILLTTRDVTEQKRAETALRALPRHITEAQETERRRVARELHDSVSQLLASAQFRLQQVQGLAGTLPLSPLNEHLVRAGYALRQASLEVRRISHGLRPRELDDLGLGAALSVLLAGFQERTGVQADFRPLKSSPKLPPAVVEALYRIAQEALTNIERHARARHVRLKLRLGAGRVTLTIADDGRGLRLAEKKNPTGLGLLHMRERAEFAGGQLVLSAPAGGGTQVVAQLPLPRAASKTRGPRRKI